MALLDIIITHWREPWDVGRKMFEMLRMQRGVDPEKWGVILVQDGPDSGLDMARMMREYPFIRETIELPAGGVSAARNAGLDESQAEWVMFCDFDDCFYTIDSLMVVISCLEGAGDRGTLIWSDLWIEGRTEDGEWAKKLSKWNTVFVHGKIYRREMLKQNGIRFDEELTYSEDAMFNAIVALTVPAGTVARLPEPVYTWCYREGSLSNYDGGDAKRNLSLYRKRVKLLEEYEKRGIEYDMYATAARTMLEYYWEMNAEKPLAGGTREEWEERIREISRRWPRAMLRIRPEDRKLLLQITGKDAKKKKLISSDQRESKVEWLKRMGAL